MGSSDTESVPSAPARPPARRPWAGELAPWVVLVALALLSLSLSLSEIGRLSHAQVTTSFDSRDYISIAESLYRGQGYTIPDGETISSRRPTSYRTPGYPFLLLALLWAFGPAHYLSAALLLQNLLLAALPSLFYWLTALLGGERRHSILAAVVCFLFLPFRILALLIQPELVALCLLLAALCLLLWFRRRHHPAQLAGFTLCLGACLMVKQNLVVLMLLFVAPLPRLLTRRQLAVAVLAPALFVGGWVVRNSLVWGRFPLFTSTSGLNLYQTFNPRLKLDLSNLRSESEIQRHLMNQGLTEVGASDELRRRGWRQLRELPFGWHLQRMLDKVRIQFRELFPFVKNELFFILLPLVLTMKRGRLALLALLLFQLVYSYYAYDLELSPSGLYYRSLVDTAALSVMALLSFVLLMRSRTSEMLLLGAVYLLIVAPNLVFFPVDRMTYVADSVLIALYALAPEAIALRFRREVPASATSGAASPANRPGAGPCPGTRT